MINRQPSHHQYLQIWDYLTIFSVSLMVSMIVEFFILILSSIIHSPTLDTLADIVFGICAARVPSPASNPSLQRRPPTLTISLTTYAYDFEVVLGLGL